LPGFFAIYATPTSSTTFGKRGYGNYINYCSLAEHLRLQGLNYIDTVCNDYFDYIRSTFVNLATNTDQEGLRRDPRELIQPGIQVLPGECKRRSEAMNAFSKIKMNGYAKHEAARSEATENEALTKLKRRTKSEAKRRPRWIEDILRLARNM